MYQKTLVNYELTWKILTNLNQKITFFYCGIKID